MINILIDFKVVECNNGHINECVRKECKVCGEPFSEFNFESDPYVDMRIAKMESILKFIEMNENRLKSIKKEFRKGTRSKEEFEDYYSIAMDSISTLSDLCNMNVFEDLNLTSENIENPDLDITLTLMHQYLEGIFNLIFKLLSIKSNSIWKNIIRRILATTISFKDSSIQLIFSTTSKTLDEAKQIEADAQEKLDIATSEINVLGSILGAENINSNINIFSNGDINISAIVGMMISNNVEGDIRENINDIKKSTYYYFKHILENPFDYYSDEEILNLTAFRFVGISAFDDENYFRKIQVSLNMINRAYQHNPVKLHLFLRSYLDKFIYMMQKIRELSQSFAYIFGNNPTDTIIIHSAIRWYKDLCEGIYRDASKLILYCCNILSNNNTDIEEVLEWTGFAEIAGRFNDQKKFKLNILTEGIEKIIRNSEAHADYDIDDFSKKVILRNKKKTDRVTDIKEYTYEDFFEIMNLLAETVYGMIAGINVFLTNNRDAFVDIINNIGLKMEEYNSNNIAELIFPLKGVIITDKKEYVIDDVSHLKIFGKYINDEKGVVLEGLISAFSPVIKNYPEYQTIELFLDDFDDKQIGSIKVHTKFIQDYFNRNTEKNDYLMLLAISTTEVNYANRKLIEPIKRDFEFLFEVLNLLMPQFEKINKNRFNLIINFDKNVSIFQDILEEIDYSFYILQEYLDFSYDKRFVNHVIDIIKSISKNLKRLIQNSKLNNKADRIFKNIANEMMRISELPQLFLGDIDKEIFFRTKTSEGINIYKNVGVNDPCPCGSGKKYKKCCKK